MSVKQWGFAHSLRATFDDSLRAEFLIGYPFAFTIPVAPDLPTDLIYLRRHLGDMSVENSGSLKPELSYTYADLDYIKRYL